MDTPEQLMAALRQGDGAAFETLLERFESAVLRYCRHFLGHEEEAQDAAQDVFLSVLSGAGGFRPGSSFRPWLFAIARNRCIDALRRQDPASPVEEASHLANGRHRPPEEALDVRSLRRAVRRGMGDLDAGMREAVSLRFLAGLSYEEMADVTQLPVGTLASRVHRGLRKLSAVLTPYRNLVQG